MSLYDKINEDLKTALKEGKKERVEVLRFTISQLYNLEKEKRVKDKNAKLTDEEVAGALQREAKRRREALELFRKGGRADLVKKEEGDLKVIAEYLPEQLNPAEVRKIIEEARKKGFSDFNSLMRETMKAVRGKADGKMVGELVKEALGG